MNAELILDPAHPDYEPLEVFQQAEDAFQSPTNQTEAIQFLANAKASISLIKNIAATVILAKDPSVGYVDPDDVKIGDISHYGVCVEWDNYDCDGYGDSYDGQLPWEYFTLDRQAILAEEAEAAKARKAAEEARKKREAEEARKRAAEREARAAYARLKARFEGGAK